MELIHVSPSSEMYVVSFYIVLIQFYKASYKICFILLNIITLDSGGQNSKIFYLSAMSSHKYSSKKLKFVAILIALSFDVQFYQECYQ